LAVIDPKRYSGPIPTPAYFARHCPIDRINERAHRYYDMAPEKFEANIRHVMKDIAHRGLVNPLYIKNLEGQFALYMGKHRVAACERLGWTHVPILVSGPLPEGIEGVLLTTVEEAQAYLGEGLAFVDKGALWTGYMTQPDLGTFSRLPAIGRYKNELPD